MGTSQTRGHRRSGPRDKGKDDALAYGLGAAAAGMLFYGLWDSHRQARVRRSAALRYFVDRWQEYDLRLREALAGPPLQIDADYILRGRFDPSWALAYSVDWVNRSITWTDDRETAGVAEFWQSPWLTNRTRRGDCEDKAILTLAMLDAVGIEGFRVVAGLWNGRGHAWLEALEGPFRGHFADPTAGTISRTRPAGYEPALWLGGPAPLVAVIEA